MNARKIDVETLWGQVRAAPDGLVTCVAQDAESKAVLMVAWVSKEALARTLESGFATYWSRSRNELWTKGDTSGNRQKILQIRLDCDGDTLLYEVDPEGPACHRGDDTCFSLRRVGQGWKLEPQRVLARDGDTEIDPGGHFWRTLERTVEARRNSSSDGTPSPTRTLFAAGFPAIGSQVKEDAERLAHSISALGPARVASDAAALLYHLTVAVKSRKIGLNAVLETLAERLRGPDLDPPDGDG